jgi:hypothetical protein
MIVPQYWAEARANRPRGKGTTQITVRRFGWSDTSQADAQRMAEERAGDALARLVRGDALDRREPKVPYNGAQGVPIREEVLARHGEVVITRNAYGAHCLNTPDVLFADVDFGESVAGRSILIVALVLLGLAAALGVALESTRVALVAGVLGVILAYPVALRLRALRVRASGGAERRVLATIEACVRARADRRLRVYRTPRGFRVLAMHRTFDPTGTEAAELFKRLGVDRIYARMCVNQRCFRARLTAKPWRIGVTDHMRPRPGTWPINPARLAGRQSWIVHYEARAAGFAACQFVGEFGQGPVDARAAAVRDLHDHLSQALSGREMA